MVYDFVDKNKDYFGLRWLCNRLSISTSCYYNYLHDNKHDYHVKQAAIYEVIKYIYYNNNRVIGHRIMKVLLERKGFKLSKATVHKYMNKQLGLTAVIMRKKPRYHKVERHKIFANKLERNFTVEKKNQVWCTDFTYMRMANGKVRFNCSIIDLYDRAVVSSVNDSNINTELAIEALSMALRSENYPKGLILHSDQGVQYTSFEFTDYCKKNDVVQSMSKAGCPYDNAPMERYYNTFKNSFYYRYIFENEDALDAKTMEFVNQYNYVRPHSHNNYLTPMEARYK